MGDSLRSVIETALPDDWSWAGQRVLDFGCGAGRVLRHFAEETEEAEFWGCDIDGPSIEWLRGNLCPPFIRDRFLLCPEKPGLPLPDGCFDLIYAISVYTHITHYWADWILEHHRLLDEGGLLFATFLGEGAIEKVAGEKWDERGIGMNVVKAGNPWDLGGPTTLHSPWWIEAHWGRAFDILSLQPGGPKPGSHGLVLLQRKSVQLSVEDLKRLEPGEPREISALQHQVQQLQMESLQLQETIRYLESRLHATEVADAERVGSLDEELKHYRRRLDAIERSSSWRLTAPLRATAAWLRNRGVARS